MATYLLTWNPTCWDVSAMADELAEAGRASAHWTTVSRKIREGDTIVFLRQGVEPRGVVGLGRATGATQGFEGDVVAMPKRALRAGEVLDGEGGRTVWGKLLPARRSLELGALPIGLAHGVRLRADVPEGRPVRWEDVTVDEDAEAVRVRREMEARFGPEAARG